VAPGLALAAALLSACAPLTPPPDGASPTAPSGETAAREGAVTDALEWVLPDTAALARTGPPVPAAAPTPAASVGPAVWQNYVLPGKQATEYRVTTKDGRWAVEARASRSASMYRRPVDVPARELAALSWSWWIDAPLVEAELGHVERTDAPASIVLAFDGDKSRLPMRARMMFDLARALTGEEPPYATLVYAWGTSEPLESVVLNPRSDRIRKIVVDSGSAQARRWREHRRDVVADYRRAFGEEPGRLIGVALMTDADNTRAQARAWYGRLRLERRLLAAPVVPAPAASAAAPGAPAAVQGSSRSVANN
jgi:hypothetical protein